MIMEQDVRPTDWQRPENQLVYRRHLVWDGWRVFNGDEFHTYVPVFGVHASHRQAYVIPADPEDEFDRDRIGYVSDDIATAICVERLRFLREREDPWSLPKPTKYDPSEEVLPRHHVRFAKAEVFAERDVLALPVGLAEGWGLGEIRARLTAAIRAAAP